MNDKSGMWASNSGCIAVGREAKAIPDPLWVARLRWMFREQTTDAYWEGINRQRKAMGLRPWKPEDIAEYRKSIQLTDEDRALLTEHGTR